MIGWLIPPPKTPSKSKAEFARERVDKVNWLIGQGLLKSERIKQALLKVPREDFLPSQYRDYAYEELPFPLPGVNATISCPHSYPLFYEPLGLDHGQRFLEVGLGSGYGTAIAREVVGSEGLVVALEIDPLTLAYAKDRLTRAGYTDVVLVNADGGMGFPELAPYDRISVTAACRDVPPPLIEQLAVGGRLILPVIEGGVQNLVVFNKSSKGMTRQVICQVLYVGLQGVYGASKRDDV